MLAANNAGERAQWQVLWVKKGTVHRKDFGHDLMAALALRDKLIQAERKNVTLRCKNMGFPPPEKYLPHEIKAKKALSTPKVVRVNGKRYRKTHEVVTVMHNPMKDINVKGIWWCPYCQKFRRFVRQHEMTDGTIRVADNAMACPMCRITHRDHNVKKWNPMAIQVFYELEVAPQRAAPKDRRAEYRRKKRANRKAKS